MEGGRITRLSCTVNTRYRYTRYEHNHVTGKHFRCTLNTRYGHARYKHSHVTGSHFRCTNFSPPNRLRYRHITLQAHQKAICAYNELCRDTPLGGNSCFKGDFGTVPAHSIFSLKYEVAYVSEKLIVWYTMTSSICFGSTPKHIIDISTNSCPSIAFTSKLSLSLSYHV